MIGAWEHSQNSLGAMGERIVTKTTMWFHCLTEFLSIMKVYLMKAPAKPRVRAAVDGFAMCKLWVHSRTISWLSSCSFSHRHTLAGYVHTHSLTRSHLHLNHVILSVENDVNHRFRYLTPIQPRKLSLSLFFTLTLPTLPFLIFMTFLFFSFHTFCHASSMALKMETSDHRCDSV